MSATRDTDRILRAWLEQMPDEAPDRTIAAVLQATAAAPQVRDWPWLGRWRPNQMNRLSLIAAAAVVMLALAGGAMLLVSGNKGPGPIATPSTPTTTPAPTSVAGTTADAIRSTWAANAPTGSAATFLTLAIGPSLITVMDAGSKSVVATALAAPAGELAFVAPDSNHGCQKGDEGRYGYAFGADPAAPASQGTLLTLTVVTDACPTRQAALARTWVRGVSDQYKGGRFVATQFSPMFMVTLPEEPYAIKFDTKDALMIEPPVDGWHSFVATRNPWGWTEPCTDSGGAKLPVDPSIDAFVAYLDNLPGFSVERSPVTLGSTPAVRLKIPTTKTPECQNRGANSGRVMEWTNSDLAFGGGWILGQGDTDVMYLVEAKGALFVFQWLGSAVTQEQEMAVLSTITVIDSLPS